MLRPYTLQTSKHLHPMLVVRKDFQHIAFADVFLNTAYRLYGQCSCATEQQ